MQATRFLFVKRANVFIHIFKLNEITLLDHYFTDIQILHDMYFYWSGSLLVRVAAN